MCKEGSIGVRKTGKYVTSVRHPVFDQMSSLKSSSEVDAVMWLRNTAVGHKR